MSKSRPQCSKRSLLYGVAVSVLLFGLASCDRPPSDPYKNASEQWLLEKAAQGDTKAKFGLGFHYMWGPVDGKKAVEWLEKAASEGHAEAQRELGLIYAGYYPFISGLANPTQAMEWLQTAANSGDPEAPYYLGDAYDDGKLLGVEARSSRGSDDDLLVSPDPFASVHWYLKAADHQNENTEYAEYFLGNAYLTGNGVSKDAREAAKWYEKAAVNGSELAALSLGKMYLRGDGVERNLESAKRYLAADSYEGADIRTMIVRGQAGYADSQIELGRFFVSFADDESDDKNDAEGLSWFKKAAEQGNAEAQYLVGLCYGKGKGVTEDAEEAVRWTDMAASQGHTKAQRILGSCYVDGYGVSQDYVRAAELLREASIKGDPQAQSDLGQLLNDGKGVPKNQAEAYKWFLLALSRGIDVSKQKVKELEQVLSRSEIAEGQRQASEFQFPPPSNK